MVGKGFTCQVELSLHLLSSIGTHECPGQLVYLSIEMFGTVHKTKPQHSYYPLIFNEVINFQKTFWSPSNEDEVLDMLEDSSVVIELRRLDPCFYSGLLLSYYDGNAKDFLFSRYSRVPCSLNGQEIYLDRTVDFTGTSPRLRYSVFADIKKQGPSIEPYTTESKYSINNRSDDGYHSPTQSYSQEKGLTESSKRLSRSRNLAGSTDNLHGSKPYYTRQTVSSALRSRSPSPIMNKSNDDGSKQFNKVTYEENEKPPFVVRKVPDSLITRSPKLHDNLRSSSCRRGRSKRRQSSGKNKPQRSGSNTERRFRSASASRIPDFDGELESYKPSTMLSSLRTTYDTPHQCYRYSHVGRCHSPLFDCCNSRLSRLSCLSPSRYHCCHSYCSHWI